MFVINKRVGTINVRTRLSADQFETRVSGDAYPFPKKFFGVSFSAIRKPDFSDLEAPIKDAAPEIGFGGNQFQGEKAARMLQAAHVAYEQATYYANLINDIAEGNYASMLHSAAANEDKDGIIDLLLLAPEKSEKIEQGGLISALRILLFDGRLLGGNSGRITSDNFDALEELSQNGFYGLMKGAYLTDRFEGNDLNKAERIEATKEVIDYINGL